MPTPFALAHTAALACAVAASAYELRVNRIPNDIPLAGLVAAIFLAPDDIAWSAHALGAVVALLPGLVFFQRKWMGGGVVKLLVALGAIVGPREMIYLWLFVASVLPVLLLRRRHNAEAQTVEMAPVLTLALLVTTFGARHLPWLH